MPQSRVTTRWANPARGALVVGIGATLLCATTGLMLGGLRGSASSLLASILVLAFFVSGQIVESRALRMTDATGLTLTLASYAARVGLFGLALWLAASTPAIAGRWSNTWVAAGALTTLIGWLTGLVVADSRARVPIYDRGYRAPEGWDR